MFLQLNHKSLDVYLVVRELVKEIYLISMKFPPEERFNLISQIRRAGVSVKLNLAEGSSRKSKAERDRYYEISRGSLIEIDSIFETAFDLNYVKIEELKNISSLILRSFAMLSRMVSAN
jgi:four helix bundle protein